MSEPPVRALSARDIEFWQRVCTFAPARVPGVIHESVVERPLPAVAPLAEPPSVTQAGAQQQERTSFDSASPPPVLSQQQQQQQQPPQQRSRSLPPHAADSPVDAFAAELAAGASDALAIEALADVDDDGDDGVMTKNILQMRHMRRERNAPPVSAAAAAEHEQQLQHAQAQVQRAPATRSPSSGHSSNGSGAGNAPHSPAAMQHAAAAAVAQLATPLPTQSAAELEANRSVDARQRARRTELFRRMLEEAEVDQNKLRDLSWSGVPSEFRPRVWRILANYVPIRRDRQDATLQRKRQEYMDGLPQYFDSGQTNWTDYEQKLYHQVHIDVVRTNPNIPLFQVPRVQQSLERLLFMWSIRHPGSGYVQGINDLSTPFIVVFLSEYTEGAPDERNVVEMSDENMLFAEADTYWCLSRMLDSIHDHYTFAQPGIQRQIMKMRELMMRVDAPLVQHLDAQQIQFVHFSFRWFNCLLMRELPMKVIIRLWDTYMAEGFEFAKFHLYVCAAYLVTFSSRLLPMDFQRLMLFLQNPPTQDWDEGHIEEILSQAFLWKSWYDESPSHLRHAPAAQPIQSPSTPSTPSRR